MAREADIFAISCTLFTIPPGGSFGLYVLPVPGEVSSTLKYFQGGSLELVPARTLNTGSNPGATNWLGASLNALQGTGYLMNQSEVLNFSGPARYYLIAAGATTQAYMLRGLTQGF